MSHSNNIGIGNPDTTGHLEDYLIVPQNSPDRPTWYASSDLYTGLASTVETQGDFNAFDFFLPVGGGPPLHYHTWEHEAWYGIEGNLFFGFGNEAGEMGSQPKYRVDNVVPGTLIYGPRLRSHIYGNADSTETVMGDNIGARTLSITTPGGLDLFFNYVGIPVEDRGEMAPPPAPPTPEQFQKLVEIGARVGGAPYFVLPAPDYEPPEGTIKYIVVLPHNPPQELVDQLMGVKDIEGFSIWQKDNDPNIDLPNRPTFTEAFGLEYTSLLTLQETGGEFAYNEFSMLPETADVFAGAKLTAGQVMEPSESESTGIATVSLDEEGNVDYTLTVKGLDFGQFEPGGIPQTPEEGDDVTGLHIHSGARGTNGPHEFSILDLTAQDETDPSVIQNDDGSVTISGTWSETEKEIPTSMIDFLNQGGLPGKESDFYFQVHTQANPQGEIRGQIALNSNDFPEPRVSQEHEVLYVKEGQLSLEVNGEVRLAKKDDFIQIAPGNEYSIGNFGDETVQALAVTIIDQEEQKPDVVSPLRPLPNVPPEEVLSLSNESDVFDEKGNARVISAGKGDDTVTANKWDLIKGQGGDDLLDASDGKGENRLSGGRGNDQILVKKSDRAYGGSGQDIIDASDGKGRNGLNGGPDDDILFAGLNDQLIGGSGDDSLYIVGGGNNLLYGGTGADQFWLANGQLPDAVPEPRQNIEVGPPFQPLPPLLDTRNTIVDFELGVDKIGIQGINGIDSFEDLKLLPAFGDIQSTSIVAVVEGMEAEISLGNVLGVTYPQLTANDFVFG